MVAPTLRGYQVNLVERLRWAFRQHHRVVCVLPTGGGKTVVAGEIMARAAERGSRTLFLAHRVELLEQTSSKLDLFGVDHAILKAGHARQDATKPVQVASVQTLARRLKKLSREGSEQWGGRSPSWRQPFDLVVVDECHHVCAAQYVQILEANPDAHVLGLTATPYRLDGKGLGDHFEHLEVGAHVPDLIGAGWLVPTRTFAPSAAEFTRALDALKARAGEFPLADADQLLNCTGPIHEIVATWRSRAADRITVAFACTVEHAEAIAQAFRDQGVSAAAIDGDTDDQVRDQVLADLRAGTLRVVVNCQLLTEGWDLPACSAVILARPTRSRALWRQMVGRGMRSSPGKTDCLVLDHAACAHRFGVADEADEYDLAAETREDRRNPSGCPHCFAVFQKRPEVCPECGTILRQPNDGIRDPDGAGGWTEREASQLAAFAGLSDTDRHQIYQDLLRIGRERGYKSGWAAHRYRDRFGRWPLSEWREEPVHA